jgi:hypothetical protein
MSDAERQPTEEEVRAYLAQLRQANVVEIIAQAFSVLVSGAEVKLGRRDARLLIDVTTGLVDAARPGLDKEIAEQMDAALNQLRLAQVDAEKKLQEMREEGKIPEEEGEDEAPASAAQPPPSESSAASRLWIPGR